MASAAACAGGDDATSSAPSTTASPGSTTTTAPERDCDEATAYEIADEAIAAARLAPGGEWSTDTEGSRFVERTRTAEELRSQLALDCGVRAVQTTAGGDERLLLAAWTGDRAAFVVQASDAPSEPYAPEAIVTIVTEDPRGEFLRDDRSLWAARLEGGETLVLGHLDYSLGATAKAWQTAVPPLLDAEPTIEAERYAIETLEAAGQRNVAVAEPAEVGSEAGAVMFVSPTGQILVADVAPEDWIDPMSPRYLGGPSTTSTIAGVDVRVTEAGPDDLAPAGAELGWWCGEWGWILQPPLNGTADEMLDVARAVVESAGC